MQPTILGDLNSERQLERINRPLWACEDHQVLLHLNNLREHINAFYEEELGLVAPGTLEAWCDLKGV